jgi:hypothetical protein
MKNSNPSVVPSAEIAVSFKLNYKDAHASLYLWNEKKQVLGFGEVWFNIRCLGMDKKAIFPTVMRATAKSYMEKGLRYSYGPILYTYMIMYASDPRAYKRSNLNPRRFDSWYWPFKWEKNYGLIPDRDSVSVEAARMYQRLLTDSTYRNKKSELKSTYLGRAKYLYHDIKSMKSALNYGYKAEDQSISILGKVMNLKAALLRGTYFKTMGGLTDAQLVSTLAKKSEKLWEKNYDDRADLDTIEASNISRTYVEKK